MGAADSGSGFPDNGGPVSSMGMSAPAAAAAAPGMSAPFDTGGANTAAATPVGPGGDEVPEAKPNETAEERNLRAHATALQKFKHRALWAVVGVGAVIAAGIGIQRSHVESNKQDRAAESQAQLEEGQREITPRLRRSMQQVTPADDMNAFRRFAESNECRGAQIAHMMEGNAPMSNCSGQSDNGMDGRIGQDRISFSYQRYLDGQNGQGGFVTGRVTVQPITRQGVEGASPNGDSPLSIAVHGRSGVGRNADTPPRAEIPALGVATMRGFAAQGRCAVVSTEITASFNFRSENNTRPIPTSTINGGNMIERVFVSCADDTGRMSQTEAPTPEAMQAGNRPQAEAPQGNVLIGNNNGQIRFGRPGGDR